MPATTRSQARAAQPALAAEPNAQQAQQDATNQGDFVTLNWVFFDRSNARKNPCAIELSRALFNERAENLRDFFASALKEKHGFDIEKTAIEFWKVSDLGFS